MGLKFFYNVYKSIDESIRRVYIIDVLVDENGYVKISLGTEFREGDNENPYFSLDKIKSTPFLYNSLCKKDQKLINVMLLAEGDLIVVDYNYETEKFQLKSLIYTDEVHKLSLQEIGDNNYIKNRINKQHFKKINELT